MVKGYIFDYGGTLDTNGCHWGRVLFRAYQKHHIPIKEEQFFEAYVFAERYLGKNPVIKKDFTFFDTLKSKLSLEIQFLREDGSWNVNEEDALKALNEILHTLYLDVKKEISRSKNVLEKLSKNYPMALVSNFYGNINVVLKEFHLDSYFKHVIESAVVGVRKPDPKIFSLGVEALGLEPKEVIVVGDSFSKDIIPAKEVGCKTIWFKGEGWIQEEVDENIPDMVITSLEECLK